MKRIALLTLLATSAHVGLAQSDSDACEERDGNCRGCINYETGGGFKPCFWCRVNDTASQGLCSNDWNSEARSRDCPDGKVAITTQISDCVEVSTESLLIAVILGVLGAGAIVACYYYHRQKQDNDPFSKKMKEENMRRKAKEMQAEHDNKHREFKVVKDRNGNQRLVIVDHDEEVRPDTGGQAQGPRWKCSRCTTDNNSASIKCSGCGTKRPGSSGAPQQLREPPPGVELPPGTRLGMDGTVYKEDGWVVIGKLKVVDDDEDDYGEGPGEGGYGDDYDDGYGGEGGEY